MFFNGKRALLFKPNGAAVAGHADTWYKYASDTEWRTVSINGAITGVYIHHELDEEEDPAEQEDDIIETTS